MPTWRKKGTHFLYTGAYIPAYLHGAIVLTLRSVDILRARGGLVHLGRFIWAIWKAVIRTTCIPPSLWWSCPSIGLDDHVGGSAGVSIIRKCLLKHCTQPTDMDSPLHFSKDGNWMAYAELDRFLGAGTYSDDISTFNSLPTGNLQKQAGGALLNTAPLALRASVSLWCSERSGIVFISWVLCCGSSFQTPFLPASCTTHFFLQDY